MSKCESNIDELIVPELAGIAGTVSSRLAEYRDWHGDVQADVSDLETCASNLEIQGLAITAIDFVNPCARYSEVSFKLGDHAVHARLIEPVGRARVSERVPLCLMFHDIDRPVRGWHHMTRFAAMGYAVLALDDDDCWMRTTCSGGLLHPLLSSASVGVARWRRLRAILMAWTPTASLHGARALAAESRWRFLLWTSEGLACTAVANPIPGGLEALSSRVRGSVLMGTSLMDAVSDPKGQFAVFNGLECDRRHIIYAKYAHERINAFENEVVDFFNQTFYPCSLA